MPQSSPAILTISRGVLRLLVILNWVCGAAFLALLVMSIALEQQLLEVLARDPLGSTPQQLLTALRMIVILGLFAVPLGHLVLTRLLAIVNTVRAGDPFIPDNARRLTMIAWGLLGLQVIDLLFGAVAIGVNEGGGPLSGWTFNMTGWLAVLLLFVLARVFEQGARMRDDIEGTV